MLTKDHILTEDGEERSKEVSPCPAEALLQVVNVIVSNMDD